MNVLLVTVTYPPEIRAIAAMMEELAQGLAARGHSVTVVTAWPTFNLSPETQLAGLKKVSREKGVTVIRVKTLPFYRTSFCVRGVAQLVMPSAFIRAVKRHSCSKFDTVIVYSPPLPLAQVGAAFKREGARFLLNVQDIFPQNAIDLGILKNRLLIGFFERMERAAYASADAISSHTDSSAKFLLREKKVPREKVSTVYNWIDTAAYDLPRKADFRRRFGIADKFVFLFSGVIGPSQGLELVLDTASRLSDIPDIHFLFLGEGTEKKRLAARAALLKLRNVQFEPYVPWADYPRLSREMDAGLICLSSKNKTPVIPGKLLGFMAASLPVCAFLNPESDAHSIIAASGCGYSCRSDDPKAAEALVRRLYAGRRELGEMGEKGRQYCKEHFSREKCVEKLAKLVGL